MIFLLRDVFSMRIMLYVPDRYIYFYEKSDKKVCVKVARVQKVCTFAIAFERERVIDEILKSGNE